MLPPVRELVLQNNPRFAELHGRLSRDFLNRDGSTKSTASEVLRGNAAKEDLRTAQINEARNNVLRHSLGLIGGRVNELSNELQEVVATTSSLLNARLSAEDRELLQDDVDQFMNHIRPIGQTLSSYIAELGSQLAWVAHPEESKHQRLRGLVPLLPQQVGERRHNEVEAQDDVASQRLQIATTASAVADAHRQLLEAIIRTLEQTQHGSVARGVRAHTDHLATVAESMEAKLRLMNHDAVAAVYTPEVQSALQNYDRHLRDATARLQERKRTTENRLEQYEREGGGELKTLVAEYSRILDETEGVKSDIKRLGGEA